MKHLSFITFILAIGLSAMAQVGVIDSLPVSAPTNPDISTNNLKAWWKLTDGSGTNAADFSGNNLTMALKGSALPQWISSGRGVPSYSTCLSFIGATGICSNADTTTLNPGTSDFTVSYWFLVTSNGATVSKRDTSSTVNSGWGAYVLSGNLRFDMCDGSGTRLTVSSPGSYSDGLWHLATGIYTRTGNLVVYGDGIQVATVAISSQQGSVGKNDFGVVLANNLSGAGAAGNTPFSGSLSDVRIYFRAIASNEVATLYRNGAQGVAPATNYYISSLGNDSNDGLTKSTPWLTIGKVNSSLPSTAQANFRGGDTFNDATLSPVSGNIFNQTIYTSYGTGRAIIKNTTNPTVGCTNKQYFTVNNLILTNLCPNNVGAGGATFCVDFECNTATGARYNNVKLINCDISGALFTVWILGPSGTADGFDGMSITNNTVHDGTERGIHTGELGGLNNFRNHRNTYIAFNTVYNIYGDTVQNGSGSAIVTANASNSIVEYNVVHDCGANYTVNVNNSGPAAFYAYQSTAETYRYNIAYNIFSPGGVDGCGIGFDQSTTGCLIEYNYMYNCAGAGFYSISTTSTNNLARFNLFVNNNYAHIASGSVRLDQECVFANNTVVCSNTPAFYSPGPAHAYNNIFRNQSGAVGIANTSGCVLDGNNYAASGSSFSVTYMGTNYTSIATFRSNTGQENYLSTARGIVGDPNLVTPNTPQLITDPTLIPTIINQIPQAGSVADQAAMNLTSIFGLNMGGIDIRNAALRSPYSIGCFDTTN